MADLGASDEQIASTKSHSKLATTVGYQRPAAINLRAAYEELIWQTSAASSMIRPTCICGCRIEPTQKRCGNRSCKRWLNVGDFQPQKRELPPEKARKRAEAMSGLRALQGYEGGNPGLYAGLATKH